ncbi:fibronectin type III [Lutibacter holmesii]|uniref:Fibronectin type III n=1 Tax=Lutibacter holmesii TaxID=1137985 RepID=A0ABW3WQ38_9FLAO
MKKIALIVIVFSFQVQHIFAQVVLKADGPGETYELINSVFAPGYNAVEAPDCSHPEFGRHIDEIFDEELNDYVFRFFIHKSQDNDRCKKFDRQRNEIKSYKSSPENLKAVEGEKVIYKWKFKLPKNFQLSSNFTHLHQIKSVGGMYAGVPMYSLTARKGQPDKLELRYTSTKSQFTIEKVDITPFKGVWVEAEEIIAFGEEGSYSLVIKSVSTGKTLFKYKNKSTINWQKGAEFARPKWGVYRSLKSSNLLKDEQILFADFSIEELSK